MLPPLNPTHRPARHGEPEKKSNTACAVADVATCPHGRLLLKAPLRVLEISPHETKLTVIK